MDDGKAQVSAVQTLKAGSSLVVSGHGPSRKGKVSKRKVVGGGLITR